MIVQHREEADLTGTGQACSFLFLRYSAIRMPAESPRLSVIPACSGGIRHAMEGDPLRHSLARAQRRTVPARESAIENRLRLHPAALPEPDLGQHDAHRLSI